MAEHVGLFLPLPKRLARQYPPEGKAGEDKTEPHVTLCYIGSIEDERLPELEAVLRRIVQAIPPLELELLPPRTFQNDEGQTILHSGVGGPLLERAHRAVRRALERRGFNVEAHDDFKPHVTIEYIDPGEKPTLLHVKPTGSWRADSVGFWAEDDHKTLPLGYQPVAEADVLAALIHAGRPDLANVLAYRVVAETTPLPKQFHKNEPGLLTVDEFLQMRNPQKKWHEPGSYETTVERMNQDYTLNWIGDIEEYSVRGNKKGYLIERNNDVVGVVHKGVLYHRKDERLPEGVIDSQSRKWRAFDVTKKKPVKYPVEYVKLVSNVARDNLKRYPHFLQNVRSGGESFQIRSEKKLVPNKGVTIVLLNSAGLEVGSATDEWGATLVRVASEYQRQGFGRTLAKLWYRWNPEKESGGFTPQGERNAVRAWEERVHEFLSRGWYSKLVREGRLTNERVQAILKGVSKRWKPQPESKGKPKPKPLYLIDFPTFMIYDRAFYDDPREEYVYGFGFYRSSSSVGDFLFRIDHDREYAKQTTALALHVAAAEGIEKIYIGRGYGDLIEYKGLTKRVDDSDYIYSKRFAPFDQAARAEHALRRKLDPYREVYARLLETAESKW